MEPQTLNMKKQKVKDEVKVQVSQTVTLTDGYRKNSLDFHNKSLLLLFIVWTDGGTEENKDG